MENPVSTKYIINIINNIIIIIMIRKNNNSNEEIIIINYNYRVVWNAIYLLNY